MFKTKLLTGVLLIMAVLFVQVGTAFASPTAQDTTPIAGTIQSIVVETDDMGETTVLVTVLDELGDTQTVRLSLDTAVALGLVTVDSVTGDVSVDETKIGQTVEIDPATVIADEDQDVHPIAAILGSFFGVEPGVVDAYHEDGFGFGVIAQAMWMAQGLTGDITTAGLILEAKETGDYSAFVLPDGSTPSNWGQFKKAVLEKKNNLGVIVSGHADPLGTEEDALLQNGNGNGNGNGHGRDNNPGKGKGKGKNKNP
jgi:hypothetical protein